MRLDRLTLRGLGPFTAPIRINLDALDAKPVAVCGPNGAGKSTLLELFPGALFRQTPTRGSLSDLATARVGARQVLFVSHNPELVEMADARVVVSDGGVEVQQ